MAQIVELSEYVKRMGEHVNLIYKQLKEIEEKITAVSATVDELKAATETNRTDISNTKENMVSWHDFDDFIQRLTDSFKELPPIPEEASEAIQEDLPIPREALEPTQYEPSVSEEASTPRTEDNYWPGTD